MLFWSGSIVTLVGLLWCGALAWVNANRRGESLVQSYGWDRKTVDYESVLFALLQEGRHALAPLAVTALGILLLGASWFVGANPLGDETPVSMEFDRENYIYLVLVGGGFVMVVSFTVLRYLGEADDGTPS